MQHSFLANSPVSPHDATMTSCGIRHKLQVMVYIRAQLLEILNDEKHLVCNMHEKKIHMKNTYEHIKGLFAYDFIKAMWVRLTD